MAISENKNYSLNETKLCVCFTSFGYKEGIPNDLELLFDVRILPNPFWVNELKDKTGLDKDVTDYIFSFDVTNDFIKQITSYLDFFFEHIDTSKRNSVNIGIGCTGGQHRSVSLAEYLKDYYSTRYNTSSFHRDLPK